MSTKRILGIIAIVGGVVLLGFSSYIKSQVGEGREKVASAQKKIDQGEGLFSLTPATKSIGKSFTGGARKKIASAEETIAYYQDLADKLQIGGFALIVLGGVVWVLDINSNKKKK